MTKQNSNVACATNLFLTARSIIKNFLMSGVFLFDYECRGVGENTILLEITACV
jgi:hypothetical protein